jgi:hypothetical protein
MTVLRSPTEEVHAMRSTHPPAGPVVDADAPAARAFREAVLAADVAAMAGLLTPDVWFRVLLPRRVVEVHDREAAIAVILEWFAEPVVLVVEERLQRDAGSRQLVGWRVLIRPHWAPKVWHRIEQVGYVRVVDGRIRRVDLVCTGFQPQP